MNSDEIQRAAGRLSSDIRPQRDLWPDIASALQKPASGRWAPMLAQAAALVLLLGASSAVTYVLVKDDRQTAVFSSPDMIFEQASFGNRYTLGAGFQDARNGLISDLDIELERLSPQARQDIRANLTLIHEAIFDINTALEADPENLFLQQRLIQNYRDELALLRRVAGLSRNVMMRNDF